MYLQNDSECVLFLKQRYGVVKLALEFGTPIYPTFCFGLRKMYPAWVPKFKFMKSWGSALGYVPVFFLGIFNIPFAQPKPTPLNVVVGKPIIVEKIEDPSVLSRRGDEEVERRVKQIHGQILSEIERIFETYKHEFEMGHVTLKIE